MLPTHAPRPARLLLALLTVLVTACASTQPPLPSLQVKPAVIPVLPVSARQTVEPLCLPTCLDAWRLQAEKWRESLMNPGMQGKPAKPHTTP